LGKPSPPFFKSKKEIKVQGAHIPKRGQKVKGKITPKKNALGKESPPFGGPKLGFQHRIKEIGPPLFLQTHNNPIKNGIWGKNPKIPS